MGEIQETFLTFVGVPLETNAEQRNRLFSLAEEHGVQVVLGAREYWLDLATDNEEILVVKREEGPVTGERRAIRRAWPV